MPAGSHGCLLPTAYGLLFIANCLLDFDLRFTNKGFEDWNNGKME